MCMCETLTVYLLFHEAIERANYSFCTHTQWSRTKQSDFPAPVAILKKTSCTGISADSWPGRNLSCLKTFLSVILALRST